LRIKDIYREERNRKICNLFKGANLKELAIMFDLAEGRIREIVNRRG
jgi:Mor family transcriptional regulator